MGIVDRVKNIITKPNTEWTVIATEPATPGGLLTGYAAPLAGASAIASFIGSAIFLSMLGGLGLFAGLGSAAVGFLVQLFFAAIIAILVNVLAPTFGGQKDTTQAFKVAVYALTPAWVFGIAQIIPFLGGLIAFLGALYGIYLMYLGLTPLMKSPSDKTVVYTISVVVITMVLGFLLTMMLFAVGLAGAFGAGMMGSRLAQAGNPAEVEFSKDSPLGQLQELGRAMERSGQEMEAAQQSGDPGAAAAAAMNSLGALFGGGKRIDPLEIDQLKRFIPDTFAGLAKNGPGSAEKNGMGAFMVSTAKADYGNGTPRRVELEITDAGAASGLMGFASWAAAGQQKEDANGSERTMNVGGRLVHERRSKNGTDEYSVVLANRFMVSAKSSDMNADELKAAVSSLDLGRLESMKDVGVQK